jgi:hypothetical protein
MSVFDIKTRGEYVAVGWSVIPKEVLEGLTRPSRVSVVTARRQESAESSESKQHEYVHEVYGFNYKLTEASTKPWEDELSTDRRVLFLETKSHTPSQSQDLSSTHQLHDMTLCCLSTWMSLL